MVSVNDPKARDIANEFARWVTFQYHDVKEFRTLFGGPEKRHELLEKTAKDFFEDIFWMYIERIILNVTKLTDKRRNTFSIIKIHNYFKEIKEYKAKEKEAETLINNIQEKSKMVLSWRHNIVAHYNWFVALNINSVRDKFFPEDIENLYISLKKYVELLFSIFNKVKPIDMVTFHGVDELIRALKEAHALRDLKESDINAYANLVSKSGFRDA